MTDSENRDSGPKSASPFRSRQLLLTLAVVLVVAIVWVASLLWVRSFSMASPAGGTPTATTPLFIYVTVTATPEPAPTVTATVTEPVQVAPMGVLGPTGVGKLQLGMSFKAAMATGLVVKNSGPGFAMLYTVKDHPRAGLCLDKANGLMAIFADKSAVTPEGIHLGSTHAEVVSAYPNVKRSVDFEYVPISPTTRYEIVDFQIDQHNKVTSLVLTDVSENCFH